MAKYIWLVKDYGSGWDANEITNSINKLAADGWGVHSILPISALYEVSKYSANVPGLNDGDQVSMNSTMRAVFKK
jgi:hypothetical protein